MKSIVKSFSFGGFWSGASATGAAGGASATASGKAAGGQQQGGMPDDQQLARNRQKLRDYHQLAKEALTRAAGHDEAGRRPEAARLYRTGLAAAREGLALSVARGSGLGPLADSVAGWRAELQAWTEAVGDRLKVLEAGGSGGEAVRPLPHAAMLARQQRGATTGGSGAAAATPAAAAGRSRPASAAAAPAGGPRTVVLQRPAQPAATPAAAQPPRRATAAGNYAPGGGGRAAAAADDGLKKYREAVAAEILDRSPGVKWDDIAGLATAKAALSEAVILPTLRPDLFQGLRSPVRGILLYGPPGNGKTMLAKALAAESRATFFNISASSLTSKWVGDGEKLVRALFEEAAARQPSIIFLDELDSVMGSRGRQGESEAGRRLLTEFLVQFDGVGGAGRERVVVVGATNRPQELDDAVRRRLTKRIYVPLPDAEGRMAVLAHLLKGQPHRLGRTELSQLVAATAGYSASDLAALCKEAAMAPLRELRPDRLVAVPASELRPLAARDFAAALGVVRPSVAAGSLRGYEDFTREYGTT
ncbi:hypothetical protein GPECTOR_75g724 [Gonium pectorale]|uniref:microtubule-severing ATPase n=1 Tax=Gonium pectorale TaxID=33097 RepID=A0A150G2H6_GONPE|nr:hypothetical protein GPECTOR_75g724 [Gonium pectorale]|eukprot:KXZ44001.1 hypothetical protein GPECTOR_75g724 [Gonium pectorale]